MTHRIQPTSAPSPLSKSKFKAYNSASPRGLRRLTWLCALRDLDLELVGVYQVLGRDAEPPRGDLLDPRGRNVAVLQPLEVRSRLRLALLVDVLETHPANGILPSLVESEMKGVRC